MAAQAMVRGLNQNELNKYITAGQRISAYENSMANK